MCKPIFHTKRGDLTRYALACGYTQMRGTNEAYVRLEQISSNGTLRVFASGRHVRKEIYCGQSLRDARRALKGFDLEYSPS